MQAAAGGGSGDGDAAAGGPPGDAPPSALDTQEAGGELGATGVGLAAAHAAAAAAADDAPPSASGSGNACYVVSYNVAKRHNIGTLARCATAFGVKQV